MISEKKTKAPESENKKSNIEFNFYFSAHGTKYDARGLKKLLDGADYYFPENAGASDEVIRIMNLLAKGQASPDQFASVGVHREFNQSVYEAVYNTNVKVISVDIPADSGLLERYTAAEAFERKALKKFRENNIEEAINLEREYLTKVAAMQKERERIITEKIKKQIKQLNKDSNGKKLRIVVSLGAAHTEIASSIAKSAEIKKMMSHDPFVFNKGSELMRALIKNPERVITDNECLQNFVEFYLTRVLEILTPDSQKGMVAARYIAQSMSADQVKDLAKGLSQTSKLDGRNFEYGLRRCFRLVGVDLPRSEDRIDEIIAKNIKREKKIVDKFSS